MKQIKRLHLKSMVVGLVFGVMSVVIMNNYIQSPINNAYGLVCPSIEEIELVVKKVLNHCRDNGQHFKGGYPFNCRD